MIRPAWQHLFLILGGLLVALAAGWIADRPALFAACYLGLVVAWQARNLIRFEHWLRLRAVTRAPDMNGLWGECVATANRLYQRKRFHKRRALTLLRELRRMTSAMPDGTILLGPTREILWFNPHGRGVAGAAPQARLRHPHRQPAAAIPSSSST